MGENLNLAARMSQMGKSAPALAAEIGVSKKSVTNWLNKGLAPNARNRYDIAKVLGCEIRDIWPDKVLSATNATAEVANAWGHRSDSPKDFWWSFFEAANEQIDLLGYAIQFLHEEHKDFATLLKLKANDGCSVRIVVADPQSQVAVGRDAEEGLNGGLIYRIQTSLTYLQPLVRTPNVEVRKQAIPMYNSIFRFDDEMLVTPHLYTKPGRLAPLFHIQRRIDDGVFDTFATSFEDVFRDSRQAVVSFA